jgi:hypothetical protein
LTNVRTEKARAAISLASSVLYKLMRTSCILVTSRFILEIVNKFKSEPTLEVRASEGDIKLFLKGRMYPLLNCVKRDDVLQVLVQEKLAAAADGILVYPDHLETTIN